MAQKELKKKPHHEHLITTVPVIRICASCGVWLAAGIAEGMHVQVDLVILDSTQSILAMFSGLQLFAMMRTGLVTLDRYRLADPRFSGKFPEHRCGTVWESRTIGAGRMTRPGPTDIPPY